MDSLIAFLGQNGLKLLLVAVIAGIIAVIFIMINSTSAGSIINSTAQSVINQDQTTSFSGVSAQTVIDGHFIADKYIVNGNTIISKFNSEDNPSTVDFASADNGNELQVTTNGVPEKDCGSFASSFFDATNLISVMVGNTLVKNANAANTACAGSATSTVVVSYSL